MCDRALTELLFLCLCFLAGSGSRCCFAGDVGMDGGCEKNGGGFWAAVFQDWA